MSDFTATNQKCITFAVITAILPIVLLISLDGPYGPYFYRSGVEDLIVHAVLLHAIASVVLTIGIVKNNYRLIVPWMVTAAIFGYMALFSSISLWDRFFDRFPEPQIWILFIYGTLAFICWAAKILYTRFDEMRKFDNDVPIIPISEPLKIKTVD